MAPTGSSFEAFQAGGKVTTREIKELVKKTANTSVQRTFTGNKEML
jgi:hypothetical protein